MPPMARIGDLHTCPMVTVLIPHVGGPIIGPGAMGVFMAGLIPAVVGDQLICVGHPPPVGPPDVIVTGSSTVLIGGKPVARIGDKTVHGGVIVSGDPTVMIGG